MVGEQSFRFGPFLLVPARQALLRGDTPVRIGGRALEILAALVEKAGDIVTKTELMARVWPDTTVEESNLKVNIAALRRALGESPGEPSYIATIVGRGYRFAIAVETMGDGPDPGRDRLPTSLRRNNLPAPTTRIFGREAVIDSLRRDLEAARLISIVGPGGSGKTTVALAVAEKALGSFRDGVWLVDLSLLQGPDLLATAVAGAIGAAKHVPDVLAAVCEHASTREMLLVLDSCEHLVETAAVVASALLAHAPRVKILVTSREPLVMLGERVRRLDGLPSPPPDMVVTAREALSYPAIQLFVERATDRLESFVLSDADAPVVASLCRSLDGLALAIELAATRIDAFGVAGLVQQLDDRLRLLSGRRAGPERQRTLTATIDWSYSLLTQEDAALLRNVSVFVGTFEIAGAAAVGSLPVPQTTYALAQLAAKSLLAIDLDTTGIAYRLLETTREYCVAQLRESCDEAAARQRHAEYVCRILERGALEWTQRPARDWVAAYGPVLGDLRAALAWADGDEPIKRPLRLRLTVAGLALWNHLSLTAECQAHAARAVEDLATVGIAGTQIEMMLQLALAATSMFTQGLKPATRSAMQRALDIAIKLRDTEHHLRILRMKASYELMLAENEQATRTLQQFVEVSSTRDPSALPDGEALLGIAEMAQGQFPPAVYRLERLFERELNDPSHTRFARFLADRNVDVATALAIAQWHAGRPDTAARTAEIAAEWATASKHELSLCNALSIATCPILYLNARYADCERYVAILENQVERHGILLWRPMALLYRGLLTCAREPHPVEGVATIERAITEFRAVNNVAQLSYFFSMLAQGLIKCGRYDDANKALESGFECVRLGNVVGTLPELLRIQATIRALEGEWKRAEELLVESMSMSQDLGARAWRLRAANDLARLLTTRSRSSEARSTLTPVLADFSEGFTTPDLVTAAALLAALD
ncbi:MAG TPA: winged helix-turn-helix domain-containing protein [Kofleriaceae bacterium]|jgi:predicted ATPase/DNA-binding winged helix-turn-helix (wHTH) protein